VTALSEVQQPYAPIRWIDQWDNLDGRIERGYAGRSVFFENGAVRADLKRVSEYARLLASIGINGCNINNVNADPHVLEDTFLPQLARVADAFRPWGIQLALAVDLSSPKVIGALDTFDPLDPRVTEWWQRKINNIYRAIADFGGFVIKADSEGRLGPSVYGRTPADAANMIARALKPHGGVVFYRAFVYNHHLDWREPKNDRAKAAYENFHPLDGKFEDNVITQIKYGPIDFQVREPVSPLFGGLEKTNEAIELQITQEYTGQQRHLCFLAPMWKEVLDFDLQADGRSTPVKELVSGKSFHRPIGGFVGVANVGMETTWLGHPLAMANLYGYGRLAWDPNLTASKIVNDWTQMTFGNDPIVVDTISGMQLASWHIYESYTGPLGAGTLTNILGSHYGPGIESSERNGWGQWHRADHDGIGMDRTVATGTGYVAQYPHLVAQRFESVATTPDELLLFFHHVPYTHVLHSGKTVIQHIYDSHYEGAERAQQFVEEWKSLKGRIDDEGYAAALARLEYQAGHAIVWRDAICNWFRRVSGIADEKGRVGKHPERVEAEAMRLEGYVPTEVTPWETASGGKAVECLPPAQKCSATFQFNGAAGSYDIDVQYFDQNNGESKFRVVVGDKDVAEWIASDHLPTTKIGGDSSTRKRITRITLSAGEQIRIEGFPNEGEHAALDYVEIHQNSELHLQGARVLLE
jgi:alpha-glucuronidase